MPKRLFVLFYSYIATIHKISHYNKRINTIHNDRIHFPKFTRPIDRVKKHLRKNTVITQPISGIIATTLYDTQGSPVVSFPIIFR